MTLEELLHDVDMYEFRGEWNAELNGYFVCRAPSKLCLMKKAVIYLHRHCFGCYADWGKVK